MSKIVHHLPYLRRSLLLDATLPVIQTRSSSSQHRKKVQNPAIDFLALEAKWKLKWDNRDARIFPCESSCYVSSPLSPFYVWHLREPTTILETLEWHLGRAGTGFADGKRGVLGSIFEISSSKSTTLDGHVQSFGADIVRTSLLLRDPGSEANDICDEELERTRGWLESVWGAILSAHKSYRVTQSYSNIPDVPEALYEPNLDRWLDYTSEEHLRWVQVPPEEPEMPDSSADPDEKKVWLAAQNAIIAYTTPITRRNSLPAIKARLIRLTKSVSNYDKCGYVCCNMHYYSARVLISLLAPSAPAFAEECWVLLHYGHEQNIGEKDELIHRLYENEIQEIESCLGRYNLPRQGQPDTLQSIFDQPFPVVREGRSSRHTHA